MLGPPARWGSQLVPICGIPVNLLCGGIVWGPRLGVWRSCHAPPITYAAKYLRGINEQPEEVMLRVAAGQGGGSKACF